jgi:hypothetical protein
MTAPQTKKVSITKNGMIDQASSRMVEPSICSASRPRRRRYLMESTVTARKIAAVITPATSNR